MLPFIKLGYGSMKPKEIYCQNHAVRKPRVTRKVKTAAAQLVRAVMEISIEKKYNEDDEKDNIGREAPEGRNQPAAGEVANYNQTPSIVSPQAEMQSSQEKPSRVELNSPMKLHIGAKRLSTTINPSDYPLLTSKGIDVRYDYQIKGILHKFVKLAAQVKDEEACSSRR
jgi:hypothetical protein